MTRTIGEAVYEAAQSWRKAEAERQAEEENRRRLQEEERQRAEAEERARKEAEQAQAAAAGRGGSRAAPAPDGSRRGSTARDRHDHVSAADVKELRERTGAPIMDCKAALAEASGDVEKAIEILRVRGQASAAKRSGRATSEGIVTSYIHATGKVGVLVEVQCETDFVARSDDFQEFAREVAIHIAGAPSPPVYVSAEEIPGEARDAERSILEEKAREEGKPDEVIAKVVDGQLPSGRRRWRCWSRSTCAQTATRAGRSRICAPSWRRRRGRMCAIARFARFAVGESGETPAGASSCGLRRNRRGPGNCRAPGLRP